MTTTAANINSHESEQLLKSVALQIDSQTPSRVRIRATVADMQQQLDLDELLLYVIAHHHNAFAPSYNLDCVKQTVNQLGQEIASQICSLLQVSSPIAQVRSTLKAILRSTHVRFTTATCQQSSQFTLQNCPLLHLTTKHGLAYTDVEMLAFSELIRSAVFAIDSQARVSVRINQLNDNGWIGVFGQHSPE